MKAQKGFTIFEFLLVLSAAAAIIVTIAASMLLFHIVTKYW